MPGRIPNQMSDRLPHVRIYATEKARKYARKSSNVRQNVSWRGLWNQSMPSCQTRHTIYLHQMCITKAKLAKCFMVPGRQKKYFLSTCNSLQAEGRARGRGGGGRGRGRGQNVTTEDGGLVQFTTHCFFGFFGCGPPFQVKFGHCNFILAVGTCGYNIPTFSRFNF